MRSVQTPKACFGKTARVLFDENLITTDSSSAPLTFLLGEKTLDQLTFHIQRRRQQWCGGSLPGGLRMTEMNLERFLQRASTAFETKGEAAHLNYDFLLLRPLAIEADSHFL
jgi:hypothetical protein